MSVAYVAAVLARSRAKGSARLVALALAERADHRGICWPSVRDIAERAGIGERQAQRGIAKLVRLGELDANRHGGRSSTTIYRLTLEPVVKGDTDDTLSDGERMTSAAERVTSKAKRVTPVTQKGDRDDTRTIKNRQNHQQQQPSRDAAVFSRAEETGNGNGEGTPDAYRQMLERNADHLEKAGKLKATRDAYIASGLKAAEDGQPWGPVAELLDEQRAAAAREHAVAYRYSMRTDTVADNRKFWEDRYPQWLAEAAAAGITDQVGQHSYCMRKLEAARDEAARERKERKTREQPAAAAVRLAEVPPLQPELVQRFEQARRKVQAGG